MKTKSSDRVFAPVAVEPTRSLRPASPRTAILGRLLLVLAGFIGRLDVSAIEVETLAMFANPLQAVGSPIGAPVPGAGGTFLGLAQRSGAGSGSPLFQINSDGTDLHVIRRIEDANWLSAGTSNRVYVTTSSALWSFNNTGGGPRLLHTFGTNQVANGLVPSFGVVDAGTGWLYGMTLQGGASNQGVVYRIRSDGSEFSVIHSFAGFPHGTPGRLRMDRLGRLYGFQDQGFLSVQFGPPLVGKSAMLVLTGEGALTRLAEFDLSIVDGIEGHDSAFHILAGTRSFGSISPAQFFRIPTNGGPAQLEITLPSEVGGLADPNPGLGVDSSGRILGTSRRSNSSTPTPAFEGGVYRFDPDTQTYEVQFQFPSSQSNALQRPAEGPTGIDGVWVGFASGFLDGGMYRIDPSGTHFSALHQFSVTGSGFVPGDAPLLNPDGSLLLAGIDALTGGFQVVGWRLGESLLRTLYQTSNPADVPAGSAPPFGHLTRVSDGTIYHAGTVSTPSSGSLAISTLSNDGTQTTRIATRANLYASAGKLLQVAEGSLYGVSTYGGSADNGALFRVTPGSSGIQILFSFGIEGASGKNPQGGVVEASDGLLYGITATAKSINGGPTCFRIRKDGTKFQELGGAGASVSSGLMVASDGNLYGMVQGVIPQFPTAIIQVAIPSGTVSQVTALPLSDSAQPYPSGTVSEGPDGRLYGVTADNGNTDRGTIFSVERSGTDGRTEHRFTLSEGSNPSGPLSIGNDGWLYGIATQGGTAGAGSLFRIRAAPRLDLDRQATGTTLKATLRIGSRARFESASAISGPWTPLGPTQTTDPSGLVATQITPASAQQYYRLVAE